MNTVVKIQLRRIFILFLLPGAIAWVNSKSYELAGITRDTPDPLPGGHYYKRDKQGNPSGFCVFKEMEIGHTRRYIGAPDSYFLPPESEKMSVESLIKGYTMGWAYHLGIEDKVGSIETGKYADIIVLEKNFLEQKADDIHNNKFLLTIMDGRVVYDKLK